MQDYEQLVTSNPNTLIVLVIDYSISFIGIYSLHEHLNVIVKLEDWNEVEILA